MVDTACLPPLSSASLQDARSYWHALKRLLLIVLLPAAPKSKLHHCSMMLFVNCMQATKWRTRLSSNMYAMLRSATSQRRCMVIPKDQLITAGTWYTPDPSKVVSEMVVFFFFDQATDLLMRNSNLQTSSVSLSIPVGIPHYTPLSFLQHRPLPTGLTVIMNS